MPCQPFGGGGIRRVEKFNAISGNAAPVAAVEEAALSDEDALSLYLAQAGNRKRETGQVDCMRKWGKSEETEGGELGMTKLNRRRNT